MATYFTYQTVFPNKKLTCQQKTLHESRCISNFLIMGDFPICHLSFQRCILQKTSILPHWLNMIWGEYGTFLLYQNMIQIVFILHQETSVRSCRGSMISTIAEIKKPQKSYCKEGILSYTATNINQYGWQHGFVSPILGSENLSFSGKVFLPFRSGKWLGI